MWINHCRGPLLHTEAFIHKIWKLQASSIKIYLHIKLPFAYCQLLNHPYEPQNLLEILGQHRHSNATQVFQIFCYSFSISRLAGVSLLSNSLYRDHTLSQLRRRLVSRSLQTSGNNATTVWCFPTQIITDIRNVTSSPFLVIAKVNWCLPYLVSAEVQKTFRVEMQHAQMWLPDWNRCLAICEWASLSITTHLCTVDQPKQSMSNFLSWPKYYKS